ncbi:MAG: peptide deformylase [Legionellales bacterium]|nr:peptide deformylase [Legionellales bacterium]
MQATYDIVMAGNPLLKQIAVPVTQDEFETEQLIQFTDVLLNRMMELEGVGLAAPQIGVSKRIIAIGVGEHNKRKRPLIIPNQIIINPVIHPLGDEIDDDYEACLSVGDLAAKVPRYRHIVCKGLDVHGKSAEIEISDLHARIIQHEIDHLDGILFLERVVDKGSFTVYEELKKLRK